MGKSLFSTLLVTLLLLGASLHLSAQDGAATDAAQSQQTTDTTVEEPAEQDDSGQADGDNPELAQTGDDDTGGGRFIPTEQLSQDLGASFPVDI